MTYYGSFGGDNCAKEPQFTMTNADRIRAMTDEELASLFAKHYGAMICPPNANFPQNCSHGCGNCWLEWLKQEVDDGDS